MTNKLFVSLLVLELLAVVYCGWTSYDDQLQWRDSCIIFYKVKPNDMTLQGLTLAREETKEACFSQCLADGQQCTHVWYYAPNNECLKYNAPQRSQMIQQLHFVQYDQTVGNVFCGYVTDRVDEPQVDLATAQSDDTNNNNKNKINGSPKKLVNEKKEWFKLAALHEKKTAQ